MTKDLEIAFTAKEITAFGGVSLLYKMLDNCHFKEVLSSVVKTLFENLPSRPS